MKKIFNYFIDVKEEMTKVVWPSRKDLIRHTIIVITTILVTGAIVAVLDFGLSKILELTIVRS